MSEENKAVRKKKRKQNDFLFLTRHIDFAWKFVIWAAIIGVTQSVVISFVPNAIADLFDGDFSPAKLMRVLLTMLVSLLLAVGSYLFRNLAESKSVLAARNAIWEHMLRAKTAYYDEHDPNTLLSIITMDAQTMGAGMVELFVFIPTVVTLGVSSIFQLLTQNPKLLLVLLVLIPIHIIYLIFMGRLQEKVGKQITFTNGLLTGYLAERIRNLMMIKTFNAEEREYRNGLDASEKLYKVNVKYSGVLAAIVTAYQTLGSVLAVVLPVLWGCYLIRIGEIDVPTFVAFYTYVASINGTIMVFSIIWGFIKDFSGRAYRIARLVEADKETAFTGAGHRKNKKKASALAAAVPVSGGELAVNDLAFRYRDDGETVLRRMSFTIPEGKISAIVGPSGSGKTTLVKLLERLYTPSEGTITRGGVDIQSFDLMEWRSRLAYVVQDAAVFSGSVRDAITYSVNRDVTDEEVEAAAKNAEIFDFIQNLPQGFDTVLATWGGSLSGGQRQRIVIARALLQNADIYIFDEPTSALDPDAAASIRKLIFERFAGKIVLVITHELGFIAEADQIVVIYDGALEGVGTHEKLMEDCTVYRSLVEQQSFKEVFGV